MKKATPGRRMLALLIDFASAILIGAIISLPTIFASIDCFSKTLETKRVIALLIISTICGAFLLLVMIVYFTVIPMRFEGQTFGKRIAKIRLIDAKTGEKPEGKLILMRETVRVLLAFATFGVSLIISFFCKILTKDGLTFPDAISHTMVVDVKPDEVVLLNDDDNSNESLVENSNEQKDENVIKEDDKIDEDIKEGGNE